MSLRTLVRDALPDGVRRQLLLWRSAGNNQECPCCGSTFSAFWPSGGSPETMRPNTLCPRCHSLERHRLFWLFLQRHAEALHRGQKVLHVAPEAIMTELLNRTAMIDYVSADLDASRADVQMDITDIDLPDDSFDVIICSHVLEHVGDDRKAMRELKRVLRPDGWALLQSPLDLSRADTYEDWSITGPKERERAFGQWDHVRVFGRDYQSRLEESGWRVDRVDVAGTLSDSEVKRYSVDPDEELYICR